MSKPIILQLGDDIKWNHELYQKVQEQFEIRRSHSMAREDFKQALQSRKFGDFAAILRPFVYTGGEMGAWNAELVLITASDLLPASCKIYASAMAGFDWIDTEALARRGIIYCNAASACTESVGDVTIYLIVSVFRALAWSALAARACSTEQFAEAQWGLASIAVNPRGHTLGIVGLGRVGVCIAQKARAVFPMEIIYHDIRRAKKEVEHELSATFYEDLDQMLPLADCVVVATPYAGKTVVNAQEIAKMKKGARLINIARGKCVDEEALIEGLESGHLAAAALDVHFNEPVVSPKLAAMKNVTLLSHSAGASLDSQIGFETLSMENILSFFETGKAITPVNLHLLEGGGT